MRFAETVVDRFATLTRQHDATGMVLLAYSNDTAAARGLIDTMAPSLLPHGLVDALCVDDQRWWSLMCTGGCCPADGTPYDLDSHPMAAEAVYAGLTAAADRSAITEKVSGPPACDVEALTELAAQVGDELGDLTESECAELIGSTVVDFVCEPRRLNDAECLRLAVLAGDIGVRDVAWALISRDEVSAHLLLWQQVVARTVAPWELAPLCLLGMAAWIGGDGALQNCCVDRATLLDPTYSLTGLLDEINRRALPPSFWDEMAQGMRGGCAPIPRLSHGR